MIEIGRLFYDKRAKDCDLKPRSVFEQGLTIHPSVLVAASATALYRTKFPTNHNKNDGKTSVAIAPLICTIQSFPSRLFGKVFARHLQPVPAIRHLHQSHSHKQQMTIVAVPVR